MIRVLIAGFGVVGRRRFECIRQHPEMEVVAISDILFEGNGIHDVGVPYCSDYRGLQDFDADALVVCLTNDVAAPATLMGLEAGMHVFCEKPPGRTVEDILAVRQAESSRPGKILKYGFNHRYHESVKQAKRIISSGRYGRVLNARGVYGKSRMIPFSGGWRVKRAIAGGGILLDQGIHMLDLIRYFAGDFDEIRSFVSNEFWGHDVEDNAWALMRNSESGCVASVHSTATQWRHKFRLELSLESGFIELSGILSGSKSYGEEKLTIVEKDGQSINGSFQEMTSLFLNDNSWQEEIDEFAEAILRGAPIAGGSSYDALAVMELVRGIYASDPIWRDSSRVEAPNLVR